MEFRKIFTGIQKNVTRVVFDISNNVTGILKCKGQKFADFVSGIEKNVTGTFSLQNCHGHFLNVTGTFLKIVTGTQRNVTGRKKHCPSEQGEDF